jgi:hypothetical protein
MDYLNFENMSREQLISKLRENARIMGKNTPVKMKVSKDTKGILKIQTPIGTVVDFFAKNPDPTKTVRRKISKSKLSKSNGGKRKTQKNRRSIRKYK